MAGRPGLNDFDRFSIAETIETGTDFGASTIGDAATYLDSLPESQKSEDAARRSSISVEDEDLHFYVGRVLCLWSNDKIGPKITHDYLEHFFNKKGLGITGCSLCTDFEENIRRLNMGVEEFSVVVFIVSSRRSTAQRKILLDPFFHKFLGEIADAGTRAIAIEVPLKRKKGKKRPTKIKLPKHFPLFENWIRFQAGNVIEMTKMKAEIWSQVKDVCEAVEPDPEDDQLGIPLDTNKQVVKGTRSWLLKEFAVWKRSRIKADRLITEKDKQTSGNNNIDPLSLSKLVTFPSEEFSNVWASNRTSNRVGKGTSNKSLFNDTESVYSRDSGAFIRDLSGRYTREKTGSFTIATDNMNERDIKDIEAELRVFVVAAPVGMGKTVFMNSVSRNRKDIAALIRFDDQSPNLSSINQCVKYISNQMCKNVPGFKEALIFQQMETKTLNKEYVDLTQPRPTSYKSTKSRPSKDNSVLQLFKSLVFVKMDPRTPRRILFLDGIDKLVPKDRDNLVEFIKTQWQFEAPPWLRLCLTTRHEASICAKLQKFKICFIEKNDSRNIEDIEMLARRALSKNFEHVEAHVNAIVYESEGWILYAHNILDQIVNRESSQGGEDHMVLFAVIQHLKDKKFISPTLGILYRNLFSRFKSMCRHLKLDYNRLLEPLLAARVPLPIHIWKALVDDQSARIKPKRMKLLCQLLYVQNGYISLMHKSMRFWLNSADAKDLKVSALRGHKVLAEWCWNHQHISDLTTLFDITSQEYLEKIAVDHDCDYDYEDESDDELVEDYKSVSSGVKSLTVLPEKPVTPTRPATRPVEAQILGNENNETIEIPGTIINEATETAVDDSSDKEKDDEAPEEDKPGGFLNDVFNRVKETLNISRQEEGDDRGSQDDEENVGIRGRLSSLQFFLPNIASLLGGGTDTDNDINIPNSTNTDTSDENNEVEVTHESIEDPESPDKRLERSSESSRKSQDTIRKSSLLQTTKQSDIQNEQPGLDKIENLNTQEEVRGETVPAEKENLETEQIENENIVSLDADKVDSSKESLVNEKTRSESTRMVEGESQEDEKKLDTEEATKTEVSEIPDSVSKQNLVSENPSTGEVHMIKGGNQEDKNQELNSEIVGNAEVSEIPDDILGQNLVTEKAQSASIQIGEDQEDKNQELDNEIAINTTVSTGPNDDYIDNEKPNVEVLDGIENLETRIEGAFPTGNVDTPVDNDVDQLSTDVAKRLEGVEENVIEEDGNLEIHNDVDGNIQINTVNTEYKEEGEVVEESERDITVQPDEPLNLKQTSVINGNEPNDTYTEVASVPEVKEVSAENLADEITNPIPNADKNVDEKEKGNTPKNATKDVETVSKDVSASKKVFEVPGAGKKEEFNEVDVIMNDIPLQHPANLTVVQMHESKPFLLESDLNEVSDAKSDEKNTKVVVGSGFANDEEVKATQVEEIPEYDSISNNDQSDDQSRKSSVLDNVIRKFGSRWKRKSSMKGNERVRKISEMTTSTVDSADTPSSGRRPRLSSYLFGTSTSRVNGNELEMQLEKTNQKRAGRKRRYLSGVKRLFGASVSERAETESLAGNFQGTASSVRSHREWTTTEKNIIDACKIYRDTNTIYHLSGAGKIEEAEELLYDFSWLLEKLLEEFHNGLIHDTQIMLPFLPKLLYDAEKYLVPQHSNQTIEEVISLFRLCLPIVERRPMEFMSQLLGRVDPNVHSSVLVDKARGFRDGFNISKYSMDTWWMPMNPTMVLCNQEIDKIWWTLDETLQGEIVTCFDFSFDSKRLALGCFSGLAYMFDFVSGEYLFTMDEHVEALKDINFSKDGLFLVSAGDDWQVCIWDTVTGTFLSRICHHKNKVWKARFVGEVFSRVMTCSQDGTVREWVWTLDGYDGDAHGQDEEEKKEEDEEDDSDSDSDSDNVSDTESNTNGGETILDFRPRETNDVMVGIGDFAISKTREGEIIVACDDFYVYTYSIKYREIIDRYEGNTKDIRTVSYSNDETLIASGGDDFQIRIWEVKTTKLVTSVKAGGDGNIYTVCFAPDDEYIFSASNTLIRQWDVSTGRLYRQFNFHSDQIRQLKLVQNSVDGYRLATIASDDTVVLWNPKKQSDNCVYPSPNDVKQIFFVTVSPGGKYLIASRGKGQSSDIQIYDTSNGKVINTVGCPWVLLHVDRLAIDIDDSLLACASTHRVASIYIIALDDGVEKQVLNVNGVKGITAMAWTHSDSLLRGAAETTDGSECSRLLAVSDANYIIKIWNVGTGECMKQIVFGNDESITTLCFSPDDSLLLGGCKTTRGVVWRTDDWEEVKKLRLPNGEAADCAFSNDGAYFAVVCNCRGYLWKCHPDVAYKGPLLFTSSGPLVYKWITFTTDCKYVVILSESHEDQNLIAFDVETCNVVRLEDVGLDPSDLDLQINSSHSNGYFGFPISLDPEDETRLLLPKNEKTVGFTTDTQFKFLKQYLLNHDKSTAVVVDQHKLHMFKEMS